MISGEARLSGTIRTFDPATEKLLKQRMQEVADSICQAFGATCELTHTMNIPAVINSPAGAELMREVASVIAGEEQVTQITPMMVGEDVSEFLNRAPGCFILVGAATPGKPLPAPHHNAAFDFDERMLPTGVALLAGAAAQYLVQQRDPASMIA